MHAYLPPRVQLGQSGRESSGVERAHRGPGPGADCSAALIYSWRTMMAAWVSTDGGALAAPAHTHLASDMPAWASMSVRNHQNTLLCWLQMCRDKPGWVLLWHPHVPRAFNPQHFTNNTNQNKSTSHFLWTRPRLNGKLPLPCSSACKYGGKGWS